MLTITSAERSPHCRSHWQVSFTLNTSPKQTYKVLFAAVYLLIIESLNLIAMHESIYILYSLSIVPVNV